jgi:pimeloyl-ACP methyl ester carboxylesterase
MHIEEYGKENNSIIVMLHGANFVHCFGKQYSLAEKYHIIVPHIMGFGDEAERVFDTEECIGELANLIKSYDKKVLLVGFSLGAQLAFKLISEYPELFYAAIIVSPWLDKKEPELTEVMRMNEKQFASLKKKGLCNIIGLMNGLPSEQRKEFVSQMQKVSIETIRNSVNNGITFDSVSRFENVDFPVIALAGEKEQQSVQNSTKKMAEINSNCRYEIWEKAAHNIPPVFSKRFNKLITDTAQ